MCRNKEFYKNWTSGLPSGGGRRWKGIVRSSEAPRASRTLMVTACSPKANLSLSMTKVRLPIRKQWEEFISMVYIVRTTNVATDFNYRGRPLVLYNETQLPCEFHKTMHTWQILPIYFNSLTYMQPINMISNAWHMVPHTTCCYNSNGKLHVNIYKTEPTPFSRLIIIHTDSTSDDVIGCNWALNFDVST